MHQNTSHPPLLVHTRWLLGPDIAKVCAIEEACFDVPWLEDDFRELLRDQATNGLVASPNPLASHSDSDVIVGYCVYGLTDSGIDILNLAVDPHFQNESVGVQIVSRMQLKVAGASSAFRRTLGMDVPDSCLSCHLLLQKLGFKAVGIIRKGGSTHFGSCDIYRFEWEAPLFDEPQIESDL